MSVSNVTGTDGAAGQTGGPAVASATTATDLSNSATATGGDGGYAETGTGPNGGTAQATATTTLTTSAATTAMATATGGAGGVSEAPATPSGDGGAAAATASATGGADETVTVTATGGVGFTGGAATASGSAISSGAASVTVVATGGDGSAVVYGGGGDGGVASDSTASAVGVTSALASVTQTGGNAGGNREAGAAADSSLNDAVSGSTDGGTLTLDQTATGGAGGYASLSTSTAGGDASSILQVDDTTSATQSASIVVNVEANGGAGVGAEFGSTAGGNATASADVKGGKTVNVTATASGGAGGSSNYSGTSSGANGSAAATAVAQSLTGDATATATSVIAGSPLEVPTVSATVTGAKSGDQTVEAATADGALPGPASGAETYVLAAVAPTSTPAGLPADFNAITIGDLAQFKGETTDSLSGPQTVSGQTELSMSLSPSDTRDLEVGFYGGAATGAGPTKLAVTVSVNGATIFTWDFASAAQASADLTDALYDLGALSTFTTSQTNATSDDVKVGFSATFATAGSGYGFGALIGFVLTPFSSFSGTVANQSLTDAETIDPFASAAIVAPTNPVETTLTVQLSDPLNGALTDPNAATDGSTYDASTGVFTATGAAKALNAILESLIFTPASHEVAPTDSVTTTVTLTLAHADAAPVTDSTTSVVVTAVNDAPQIYGALGGQSGADTSTFTPFAKAVVADPDLQSVTLTVALSDPANGVLTNLSGGYYDPATGLYSLSGPAAQVTAALQALVFKPTVGQVATGGKTTTTFTIGVNDGLSPAVTDANTTLSVTSSGLASAGPALAIVGTDALVKSGPNTTTTIVGTVSDAAQVTTVIVYSNGVALGDATVKADGSWSIDASFTAGVYDDISAAATDIHGKTANAKAPFILFTGLTGEPYTEQEKTFDSDGDLTARLYFNQNGTLYTVGTVTQLVNGGLGYVYATGTAFAGQSFSSYESYFADASDTSQYEGTTLNYTAVVGQAYTDEAVTTDPYGRLVSEVFSGIRGQAYSSFEYDYVGGVFAGSKYDFTAVASGAAYSSYETDYNFANQLIGSKFYFTGQSAQPYAGLEEDFDGSGGLARILLTGAAGQGYQTLEEDFSAGVYQGARVTFTISGQSYTSEEVDVSAANQVTSATFAGFTGTPFSSVQEDYVNGAVATTTYAFTNQHGQGFYAYQTVEDAQGHTLQEVVDNDNGTHTVIGFKDNLTFDTLGDDTFTGGGSGETFVLQPVYGVETITDFVSYLSGAGHDILSFSKAEFSSAAAVLNATTDTTGGTVITAANGDTVYLLNVSKAMLSANTADFAFHS